MPPDSQSKLSPQHPCEALTACCTLPCSVREVQCLRAARDCRGCCLVPFRVGGSDAHIKRQCVVCEVSLLFLRRAQGCSNTLCSCYRGGGLLCFARVAACRGSVHFIANDG